MACFLLAAGMFGLLAISGNYLGLLPGSTPLRGTRRRLTDAAVLTSVGILVPVRPAQSSVVDGRQLSFAKHFCACTVIRCAGERSAAPGETNALTAPALRR